MVLNIRKEFIVKHSFVFIFLTLMPLALVICSKTYKKPIDEHNRTCPFAEINLQCTKLSNLLQEKISQTYAEVNNRNHLFLKEYLNSEQLQSMEKVLFGAINEGDHPSLGFLRNGVLLQNGRLIVPLTETYLIYSSFHQRLHCSLPKGQTNADEAPLVRHAMYRFNIRLSHDQELASTSRDHIECNSAAFVDFKTEISISRATSR